MGNFFPSLETLQAITNLFTTQRSRAILFPVLYCGLEGFMRAEVADVELDQTLLQLKVLRTWVGCCSMEGSP